MITVTLNAVSAPTTATTTMASIPANRVQVIAPVPQATIPLVLARVPVRQATVHQVTTILLVQAVPTTAAPAVKHLTSLAPRRCNSR